MPENEWNLFERNTKIRLFGQMVGNPLEANIWQLDEATQRRYLADIAAAGCNTGAPMPTSFVDWIVWKLGRSIAEDYMLPYNRKLFGNDLDALGTYCSKNYRTSPTKTPCVPVSNTAPLALNPATRSFAIRRNMARGNFGGAWARRSANIWKQVPKCVSDGLCKN